MFRAFGLLRFKGRSLPTSTCSSSGDMGGPATSSPSASSCSANTATTRATWVRDAAAASDAATARLDALGVRMRRSRSWRAEHLAKCVHVFGLFWGHLLEFCGIACAFLCAFSGCANRGLRRKRRSWSAWLGSTSSWWRCGALESEPGHAFSPQGPTEVSRLCFFITNAHHTQVQVQSGTYFCTHGACREPLCVAYRRGLGGRARPWRAGHAHERPPEDAAVRGAQCPA